VIDLLTSPAVPKQILTLTVWSTDWELVTALIGA